MVDGVDATLLITSAISPSLLAKFAFRPATSLRLCVQRSEGVCSVTIPAHLL
jgi:hypothetical protein